MVRRLIGAINVLANNLTQVVVKLRGEAVASVSHLPGGWISQFVVPRDLERRANGWRRVTRVPARLLRCRYA